MANKGVFFGDIHSFEDLNLYLAPFTPEPAAPKESYIDVPGRDGSLDTSEAHGEMKFQDRNFSMLFTINPADEKTFDEKVTQVSNALNGKRCRIVFDRDPDYYWDGRLSVNKYAQNKRLGQITINARVHPYKWKLAPTVRAFELIETERTVSVSNGRKSVVPTIECTDNDTKVTFGGVTHTLSAGTYKILDIRFVEGQNELTISGTGTITFTYQEGEL